MNSSNVYSNQLQKIIYEELFDCSIQFFGILNALLFLPFHMIKNKLKGVALQAFFFFLPTKDLCQLIRTSLTIENTVHHTQKTL